MAVLIWQYKVTGYDPISKTGGLFTKYVNTFLKIKQEASGWLEECTDENSKMKYIEDYFNHEGISLEKDKIAKNPGLRAIGKLFLNSFWGKLAQRNDLKHTEIVKTRARLLELVSDPEKRITNVLFPNEHTVYVEWKYVDAMETASPYTNVVLASYVTALGRLMLYEVMEKLGRDLLYCDTDSCIFVTREGSYCPELGNFLGELTDELACFGPGSKIIKFLSGGPKFYAFLVMKPDGSIEKVVKVKGIRLNYRNSEKINFDSIENMILHAVDSDETANDHDSDDNEDDEYNECNYRIKLDYSSIRRTKNHDVITCDETKTCCIVLKKRRYLSHALSLPFGFKAD